MTIEDFLQILEDRDLVPEKIVEQVRAKVAKGDRRITPKSLLKYLVKKEFVTRRQAKQLLETTLTVTPNAESSILGMVPMPKMPPTEPPTSITREETEADVPTITPADEDSGNLVTDSGSPSGVDLYGKEPASLLSESLSKIGVGDPNMVAAIEESNLDTTEDPTKKKKKRKRGKKDEWDSTLLFVGGGGLALLIITGVIIGYLLNRESADDILALASEHFDGGSYTQAIKQYERFVKDHDGHPESSAAKVKLGMARLWKATSGSSNFSPALETAQQVLDDIGDEAEFNSAQRDLASLLPKIAQGLANQAEKSAENVDESSTVESLLQQVNAALALCTNTKYVPKTFRDEVLLSEVNQTLDRVKRAQVERVSLAKALADMQAAIAENQTAKAYQIHEQLLNEHPGLINNEQLAAKVLEISAAESAVVQYVEESQAASTEPRPTNVVAELTLANRTGKAAPSGKGTVAVRVGNAVYGLDAKNGGLRWRRFVGIAPQASPVRLPSGDLLVVNQQHNELLQLSGDTGELLWRQQFESAISQPVLFGEKALVAESKGKLHIVNITSGQRSGYVQFAQKLLTPPVVDTTGRRIYITGEHSSLYTLSMQDFSCLGVFFLNHSPGSVTTPPINVLNKVIVAINKGLSTSYLEVINIDDNGLPNQKATSRRLQGLVNTPLLSAGRRLVALTSRGQVTVYEVGASADKSSLTKIASRDPDTSDAVARYGLLGKGHIWMAGTQLLKLTILPTSDRLPVSTLDRDYLGDTFDHPLQLSGNLLTHVRRPVDNAGAFVAAMQADTGQVLWETELAVPTAGPPAADSAGMQIGAITASGSAFLLDRQSLGRRIQDQAKQSLKNRRNIPSLTNSLDLGQGRLVASAPDANALLHYRPNSPRRPLQQIKLAGPLSASPIVWDDAFVAPTKTGQVFLYSIDSGEQLGSPFQPALAPGATYDWQSPAVYGSGKDSKLILSDSKKTVYLLGRATTPQPYLAAEAEAEIRTSPLTTGFAVLGDLAVAGTSDGNLAVFELPALSNKPGEQLGAQITWGPFTVGQNILLATATEELICLDDQAKIAWKEPFTHGPPTGQPIARDSSVIVLWQQGVVSTHQIADGAEAAFTALPQPVVSGPVPFGKRLVVSSDDGTLLIVDYPQ